MKKSAITREGDKKPVTSGKEELKTDEPLSEKDEVKEAERRTNTAAKKR